MMRSHIIQYHIYADGTQLYIFFDLKTPDSNKLKTCISDVRAWLIDNKIKITVKNVISSFNQILF